MDTLDTILHHWRQGQTTRRQGCVLIYMAIIYHWAPYFERLDAEGVEAAVHGMKVQDEDIYNSTLTYAPLGWKNSYNDFIIDAMTLARDAGVPFVTTLVRLNREIGLPWYFNIFNTKVNADFPYAAIMDEFIRHRTADNATETLSSSTLNTTWRE